MIFKSICSGYFSTAYVSIINIIATPILFRWLGAEQYGLLAINGILLAVINSLETSININVTKGISQSQNNYDKFVLINAFSYVSIFAAFVVVVCGLVFRNEISKSIFPDASLNNTLLLECTVLIVCGLGLKMLSSFYRAALTGLDKLVFINLFSAILLTIKLIISLVLIVYFGSDVDIVFILNLFLYASEFYAYKKLSHTLIESEKYGRVSFSVLLDRIYSGLPITFTVFTTTIIWVFVSQADKIILARYLSLTDYAYFSISIMLAGVISLFSSPILASLQPKLISLNNYYKLKKYNSFTCAMFLIGAPSSIILYIFFNCSESIIKIWISDIAASKLAAKIVFPYSLAALFTALNTLTYYAQISISDLRAHKYQVYGFGFIEFVSIYISVDVYGILGAAYSLLISRFIQLQIMNYFVYSKIMGKTLALKINLEFISLILTAAVSAILTAGIINLFVFYFIYANTLLVSIVDISLFIFIFIAMNIKKIKVVILFLTKNSLKG